MRECCYVIIKVSDIWNNQSLSTATNAEGGIDHYDDDDDDGDDDDDDSNRSHLTTDHKEFGNKEFIVTQSKRSKLH